MNNWYDRKRNELGCLPVFLFRTSINKISQLDDIWCSHWVLSSQAFAQFFFSRDRFRAQLAKNHLTDNQKAVDRNH